MKKRERTVFNLFRPLRARTYFYYAHAGVNKRIDERHVPKILENMTSDEIFYFRSEFINMRYCIGRWRITMRRVRITQRSFQVVRNAYA